MGFEEGPYLSAALFCEKVLVETNGVKSAIRIVDRVTRTVSAANPPEAMAAFDYEVILLIRLKSGRVRGTHTVRIHPFKPSGEAMPPFDHSIYLEGEEDRGVDILVTMQLPLDQAGIYWFRMLFDNEPLTRVPLRVIYLPQKIMRPGTSPSGQPPDQGS